MRYRKKPVVIEAVQWFKHGDHPAVKLRIGYPMRTFDLQCAKCGKPVDEHGDIATLEGKGGAQEVCPGDYIITGIQGEHYPCKPDIFEMTYEPVEERGE